MGGRYPYFRDMLIRYVRTSGLLSKMVLYIGYGILSGPGAELFFSFLKISLSSLYVTGMNPSFGSHLACGAGSFGVENRPSTSIFEASSKLLPNVMFVAPVDL